MRCRAITSEVTAEMIENGRGVDPASATRRRKMTVKMWQAREKLTSASDASLRPAAAAVRAKPQERDAGIVLSWSPSASPLCCGSPRRWSFAGPPLTFRRWRCSTASVAFLGSARGERPRAWRLKFILAESLNGLLGADRHAAAAIARPNARTFVLVVLLLVAAITAMIASSIPFAVAGGLAADDVRDHLCPRAGDARGSVMMPALCIGVLVYFVVLANRLHAPRSTGYSFRRRKTR